MDKQKKSLEHQINLACQVLSCPCNNPIAFICISEKCNKNALPFLCNTQNCQECKLNKNKKSQNYCCKQRLVYAQNFFKKIAVKNKALTQDIKKQIQKCLTIFDNIIDQISLQRQKLQIMMQYYGLSQQQSNLIENIKNEMINSQYIKHKDIIKIKKQLQFQNYINFQQLITQINNLNKLIQQNLDGISKSINKNRIKISKIQDSFLNLNDINLSGLKKIKTNEIKTIYINSCQDLQQIFNSCNFENLQKIYFQQVNKKICQILPKYSQKLSKLQTIQFLSENNLDYSNILKMLSIKKVFFGQDLQIQKRKLQRSYYFTNNKKAIQKTYYQINLQSSFLSKFLYWEQNICLDVMNYLQKIKNVKYLSLIGILNHSFKINQSISKKLPFSKNLIALRLIYIAFQSNPIQFWNTLDSLKRLQIVDCQNFNEQILNSIAVNCQNINQLSFSIKIDNEFQLDLKCLQNMKKIEFLEMKVIKKPLIINFEKNVIKNPPQLSQLKNLKCLKFEFYSTNKQLNHMWIQSISQISALQQIYLNNPNLFGIIDISEILKIPTLNTISCNKKLIQSLFKIPLYQLSKINSLSIHDQIEYQTIMQIAKWKSVKNLSICAKNSYFLSQIKKILFKMNNLKNLKIDFNLKNDQVQKFKQKKVNIFMNQQNYSLFNESFQKGNFTENLYFQIRRIDNNHYNYNNDFSRYIDNQEFNLRQQQRQNDRARPKQHYRPKPKVRGKR